MNPQDALDQLVIDSDAKQGERTLNSVYEFIGRFVSYPSDSARVAHALWILHTHLMHLWDSTPRLAFLSPEPASGKTRGLEVTELLVPNAILAVNVSPAYLFRKVGSQDGATILFDEIDTVFGPKAKENEEIRGLLNAGHRRGLTAGRCVGQGKITTEEIEAFAAVALAGLGWLPDTILSRSVVIRMRPRRHDERIEQFRRRINAPEGERIRGMIEVWAQSVDDIDWAALTLPDQIRDRDSDVWETLIAVADVVGGPWPDRAREAAVSIISESKERDPSLGIRLLGDLKTVFTDSEMSSKNILAALHALPEAPWGDLKGKPLDERGLARRLRQYGVKPQVLWFGGTQLRGYRRSDLEDQWARYFPSIPPTSVTSVTSVMTQDRTVTDVTDVTHVAAMVRNEPNPDDWSFNVEDDGIPDFLDRRPRAARA